VTDDLTPEDEGENGQKRWNKRKLPMDQGRAIVIAATITAVSATLASVLTLVATSRTASPSKTSTAARVTKPPPVLTFVLTAHSRVPWCQYYEGTGTIPSGSALLIFSTPADPNGNPTSPPHYSFDEEAIQMSTGHWRTEPLQIGVKGQANFSVDIVGVLVAEGVYKYLNSISYRDLGLISTNLPPGLVTSLPVITNGRRGMACS
jgi:hypothetical protein